MPLGSLWDCKYLKKIYFMQQFCKKFHYSSYLRVKSDRDMITFLVCLALLVTAYFTYGRYLERQAGADASAEMPCRRLYDGVDYVPLPRWRAFLIQLLNIAGTGPIFGAVLGACFGPVAFLWITFGGIFMGAMHDYLSGMMLVRNDGLSIPEVVGRYLGEGMRHFMRIFSVLLLVLVGAVFLLSPAQLLANMVPAISCPVWVWLILAYYFVATLLPIDKILGRISPLFGVALVALALGLLGAVIVGDYRIPELTTLHNFQLDPARVPIVPTLFITIACGAISGFHATQSPLMARCVGNERACRSVFYGAMISESIIALIWAAVAMAFFGGAGELSAALGEHGGSAAWAVDTISNGMLGVVGGVLALLGVVAAPHHLGRYGLPLGAAHHRRHAAPRTTEQTQTILYLHSSLCGGVLDYAGRFRRRVALLRLDQTDARHDCPLGDCRLPAAAAQQPLGGAAAGPLHDLRLLVVPLRVGPVSRHGEPHGGLCVRRGGDGRGDRGDAPKTEA